MAHTAPAIGYGSSVVMHYSLKLEDGTVVDTSKGGEPLRFTMGDGTLIEGLEMALFGLKAGERQNLRITPADAFGFWDEERVHLMDRTEFPDDMMLESGAIIEFETPSGDQIPGAVLEVLEDAVRVDFNHPLAGRDIDFDVEILEVTSGK
ncbi:MAG: FKBP-type peptidyl-prolyl cis-trans isomerase [Gammaproteobacteria bacterium]